MDKRSTQLSLPMSIEGEEIKDVVKQHWNITFARQGKISVVAKRMMTLVLAQIQSNDMQLKPYYQLHASDVIKGDSGSAYNLCKKAFTDLASVVWMIEDEDAQEFEPRNILDTTKTEKKDGFKTAYKDGEITLAINPALEPYFIGMAQYSKYEIGNYMRFKSWYSMRVWEILSAYQDTGIWAVPLDEFRKLMDCEDKYSAVAMMIRKTLSEPMEELKGSDLEFTFIKVYDKFHKGKGRPAVVGLEFHLVNGAKKKRSPGENQTTIEKMKDFHPEHKRLIERLQNKWEITSENISKYLPILKYEKADKLRAYWEFKDGSKEPIVDRLSYCNKAFVAAGKGSMRAT